MVYVSETTQHEELSVSYVVALQKKILEFMVRFQYQLISKPKTLLYILNIYISTLLFTETKSMQLPQVLINVHISYCFITQASLESDTRETSHIIINYNYSILKLSSL